MAKIVEGNWFGSWLVTEAMGHGFFWCRCSCGIERLMSAEKLTAYVGKSRNCRHHESRTGKDFAARRHPLYPIWNGMMTRCYNKGAKDYARYGGSGIIVCDRWHSFREFAVDMSPRPKGKQLDRLDPRGKPKGSFNDNPYSPKTCYWATPKENSRHRRNTRYITANGQTKSVAEWSESTGLSVQTIAQRLDKHGWSEQDAVTVPKRPHKRHR